jgi:endonuclease/exonuclease/phosphatase family metal-dependent hydrolase
MRSLKILQWNIWFRENYRNTIELLKKVDADVICLQELTTQSEYNKNIDIPKSISEELGLYYYYQEAHRSSGLNPLTHQGNGIFSKYPISNPTSKFVQLPGEPGDYSQEGRVYLEVTVDLGTTKLDIGTTHLSYTHRFAGNSNKNLEARNLIEQIKEKKDRFIITGDFNETPDSALITDLQKHFKNISPPFDQPTLTTKPLDYNGFQSNTLEWRLDYVFGTNDINVKQAQVLPTDYSDHLPVLVEIET